VWVTVVATGFGESRPRRRDEAPSMRAQADEEPRRQLREPVGEPRVSRMRRASSELDVPEFISRR
jgi:hypothetical protein